MGAENASQNGAQALWRRAPVAVTHYILAVMHLHERGREVRDRLLRAERPVYIPALPRRIGNAIRQHYRPGMAYDVPG